MSTDKKPEDIAESGANGRNRSGESGGGAYPNPHSDKDSGNKDEKTDGFLGHGGQTEIAYSGEDQEDAYNATTRGG